MTAVQLEQTRPLIAALCSVPLLADTLRAALEGLADVRAFPGGQTGVPGLLRWLEPDAVVVDTEDDAQAAEAVARDAGLPLVRVLVREQRVRVLCGERWEDGGPLSLDNLRNILIGGVYRRERALR